MRAHVRLRSSEIFERRHRINVRQVLGKDLPVIHAHQLFVFNSGEDVGELGRYV